jgi:hypothetical protein
MADKAKMITLKDIKKAAKALKSNDVPARFIRNQIEADFLTTHDPYDRQWKPNDTYYASEDVADTMKLLKLTK